MLDPNFPQDVIDFHRACGDEFPERPTLLRGDVNFEKLIQHIGAAFVIAHTRGTGPLALRLRLVFEELKETLEALRDGDLVGAFDGILDLLYVVVGMGVQMGLPLNLGWEAVHRANMAKVVNGKISVGGKIQKPEGWVGPEENLEYLVRTTRILVEPIPVLEAEVLPPDEGTIAEPEVTAQEEPQSGGGGAAGSGLYGKWGR